MGVCGVKRKRLALAVVCTGTFMAMLDNIIVNNALPVMGRRLGAGVNGLQWVVEGYSLVFAALLMTGGTLGDRFGRKRAFMTGMTLFAVGSIAAALSSSLGMLVAARVVQGIGAAVLTPGSLAIIRNVFTEENERARAIGVWSAVSALGLAVGPLVSGPIVEAFGWAGVFWINVPVATAALVLAARALPESSDATGRRVDWPGQALCAVGLGALVAALIEGQSLGWTDRRILLGLAVAAASLLSFVAAELHTEDPMLDLRLFRDRVFSAAGLTGFMVGFSMFGASFFLPLLLQNVMGWSPTNSGVAGLPMTGAIIVAAPLSGVLTARSGPRLPLTAGLLLCAAALTGLSLYDEGARYPEYLWALVVLGVGMGMTFTPVSVTVMRRVAPARAGMASATINTLREVGGVLGIAVLGSVLTHRMTTRLTEEGLSPRTVHPAVGSGTGTPLAEGRPVSAAVGDAVDAAFVDGLHLALRLGGAAMLVTAVVAVVLLRPGVPTAPSPESAIAPDLSAKG